VFPASLNVAMAYVTVETNFFSTDTRLHSSTEVKFWLTVLSVQIALYPKESYPAQYSRYVKEIGYIELLF
jgi:hypothetical protein